MRVIITSIAIILSIFLLANTSTLMEYSDTPTEIEQAQITFESLSPEKQEEIRCLAHNIYFEARSEPIEGMMAVAHVTLNRAESPLFPQSICGVVKQKRNGVCQFSWWCDQKLRQRSINNAIAEQLIYTDIKVLAMNLLLNRNSHEDITDGALFYHAVYVSRKKLGITLKITPTTTIGQHIFYRMNT